MTKEILRVAKLVANQLRAQQYWSELILHWRDCVARLPGHPVPLSHLAIALIRSAQFSEAEAVFTRLRSDCPYYPVGWIGEGMMEESLNRWEQAELCYRKLLERFPNHPAILKRLPTVLIKQGRVNEARKLLQDLLVIHPEHPSLIRRIQKLNSMRKADVINHLIRTFGLRDYFEYNKYFSEPAIQEIACQRRTIAYIPENYLEQLQDERLTRQMHHLYKNNPPDNLLDLDAVMTKFKPASFDLIFFDPVHTRPFVDIALQRLPLLLKPDGLLVVHDCSPPDESVTLLPRKAGSWFGLTYQAFAQFHQNNVQQSMVIDTDHGVGILLNRGLELNYPILPGPSFEVFARDRERMSGLTSVEVFKQRLTMGELDRLITG